MKNRSKNTFIAGLMLVLLVVIAFPGICQPQISQPGWPAITKESKPWSRWWWMGSAVDEANLTDLISRYGKAGFGGLEITPIYGAVGFEPKYLSFLSPGWMKMLDVSVREARKNNMGIDMNTGTGWPFGGPQITVPLAASKLIIQKYELKNGEIFKEKLLPNDPKQLKAEVQLQAVMAYGPDNKIKDLTMLVKSDGTLNWPAAKGDWEILALFCGKTLQQVKRAAPGGAGLTFDHFSKEATAVYLSRFDSVFQDSNHGVGSFFNDSYEVYGTNWSAAVFSEFLNRRYYALQPYLRELSEKKPSSDISRRVQCDYRETISDMLRENFTQSWTKWAHDKGSLTRNQAHGSPGNLLDLYATVDIAECETFGSSQFAIPGLRRDSADIRNVDPDPVMLKFASSATNVSGKKLTSSETFTWLGEHFRVGLSQCKPEVEQAFLSGVNHVYYHGTAYSPADAVWPGWLFYASVEFSPSNSFWPHINGLNNYIARCQSVLQSGMAHNDLLVYWPVYDVWMNQTTQDLQFTIHSIDKWLYPTPFCKDVKELMKRGYSLDFVSDRLLNGISVKNGLITTKSGSSYRALVIPTSKYMPVATLQRFIELAGKGAKVIFQQMPEDIPGLKNLESNRQLQTKLVNSLKLVSVNEKLKAVRTGEGVILLAEQVEDALDWGKVGRETLVDSGLNYIRRKSDAGVYYYLVNHTAVAVDGYLPLNEKGISCLLLDPQTSSMGIAQTKQENDNLKVRLQLKPGEAMFVLVSSNKVVAENWKYLEKPKSKVEIAGPWKLQFTEGGAVVPTPVDLPKLISWTELSDPAAKNFSGTAKYTANVVMSGKIAGDYLLDLGKVCESARVWVNGQDVCILWSIPFTARIGKYLKQGNNTIEIEVANLNSNRIRQMDQQKVVWRNYHEINFVNIDYKPFDAAGWKPMDSGLLGPVTIAQYQVN
ncbi:MAG: glycosyl hydrolase [Prolixibacteraceae bacterium]